ncbi:MAG: ABC transporter substrate-binding protein [Actinomycetota bacterium]
MLAEEWTPNDDGSKWTFKLRQGVKWHSGTDFTSADVVATMDRMVEAGKLSAYMDAGGCAAIDDFTVEFTLKNPDGQFPYNVCHWNPQTVITPAGYATGTTLDAQPDGTGPFKLDSFDVSTGATFSRNDAWWGGTPYLDGLQFIFSDDLATQITGLQAGEADTCVQISVLDGAAIINNPDQFTTEAIRGAAHRQIWMNVREGTFTDVNVRTAIALGLDRQALVDTCLGGKGDVGNDHPIAPVYEFHDASQAQRERDVEKAKQLLADAGKAGLAITMHAPKLQEIPQLAELVQSQLKDIGMDVTLNVESTDTFYDRWCKVYDSTNEPAGCDGGEEFGIVDYGNRGVPDVYLVKAYATGEWNSAHYNSADFNQAVKDYQAGLTLDARKEPVSRIQALANADVPYVIPYFYNSLFAYANTVTGIRATGLGHFYCGTAGFKA